VFVLIVDARTAAAIRVIRRAVAPKQAAVAAGIHRRRFATRLPSMQRRRSTMNDEMADRGTDDVTDADESEREGARAKERALKDATDPETWRKGGVGLDP
jgi:hypothetical protein